MNAGGTRVVLPAPGAAVTTAAREWRAAARIVSMKGSIGRLTMDLAPELQESRVAAGCRHALAPTPIGQLTPVPPMPQ
jgi:hypothetical protein